MSDVPLEQPLKIPKTCGWCGGELCQGTEQKYPHHTSCCLDGQPRPCWTTYRVEPDNPRAESILDKIMREDREAREER